MQEGQRHAWKEGVKEGEGTVRLVRYAGADGGKGRGR